MPWRQGFLAETSNPVYLKSSSIQPMLLYGTEERSVEAGRAAQEYLCCLPRICLVQPTFIMKYLSTGERKLDHQSWALFVADTIVWTFLIKKNTTTTIVLSLWEDFRCLTLGFFTQFLILNSETLALFKKGCHQVKTVNKAVISLAPGPPFGWIGRGGSMLSGWLDLWFGCISQTEFSALCKGFSYVLSSH